MEDRPWSTRRIADIIIGIRHRRDLGDIDSLARSIAEVGLLHPIVVRADGVLIAGQRRLAAANRTRPNRLSCRVREDTGNVVPLMPEEAPGITPELGRTRR
jgi:ParB-like chromosome segregation protein Spo0J